MGGSTETERVGYILYKPLLDSFRPVRTMLRVKMRRENGVAMACRQRKMLPYLPIFWTNVYGHSTLKTSGLVPSQKDSISTWMDDRLR